MFRQMDLKGQTQADIQLKSTHQNTISTVRVYEETDGVLRKFSSEILPLDLTLVCRSFTNFMDYSEWG